MNSDTNLQGFKAYIYLADTQRIEFQEDHPQKMADKSVFDKVKHFFGLSKDPHKEMVIDKVKALLREQIQEKLPDSKVQASSVLSRLFRTCHVKESQLNEVHEVKKILNAIDKLDTVGSTPQFAQQNPKMVAGENAKNFVKYLFSDQDLSFRMLNFDLVKAVLISKNPEFLAEVQKEIQAYLNTLVEQLNSDKFSSPHDQRLGEILVGNILSLYPFFEPMDGSILEIPRKVEGRWISVSHELDLLQMTAHSKGDPYYACGFRPIDKNASLFVDRETLPAHIKDGSPILIFMGTPPPTTRGAAHAEFADFVPGHSVGETLYQQGKGTINEWIDRWSTNNGKKVDVYGQSLGGSLSLILTAHHPGKVGKVFAFNAPTLRQSLLDKYQANVLSELRQNWPEVNIFVQENDPVSLLGAGWDRSWNVYSVLPEKTSNAYAAHIKAFAGQHNVVVMKLSEADISSHNASVARKIFNVAVEILKVPMFVVKGSALGVQILKHRASRRVEALKSNVTEIACVSLPNFFDLLKDLHQETKKELKSKLAP